VEAELEATGARLPDLGVGGEQELSLPGAHEPSTPGDARAGDRLNASPAVER
jgi:hypothetical protein